MTMLREENGTPPTDFHYLYKKGATFVNLEMSIIFQQETQIKKIVQQPIIDKLIQRNLLPQSIGVHIYFHDRS